MSDPKSILLDIEKEVAGVLLSETFVVRNRKWTMKLLDEGETAWTFSLANVNSHVELALSVRLANLAVGIRFIDGIPIDKVFEDRYVNMDAVDREFKFKDKEPKYIFSQLMYEFLQNIDPDYIKELQAKWNELEKKREAAQAELKNSSGESSQKDEKQNLTELSQSGDK